MSATETPKIDYNAKVRVINLTRKKDKSDFKETDSVKALQWEGKEFGVYDNESCIPEGRLVHPDEDDMTEFLKKHFKDLHHGDLLQTMNTDRAGGVHIVCYNESSRNFKAILNPDESGSGYLTIPCEVLKNVTNAMEKYKDVFEEDAAMILNMHISPKDNFVTERLGEEVPENWEIDLHINEGSVEESYVKISDSDEWQDFDIEDSTIESIQDLFYKGEKSNFTVSVELREEKYEAYKQKYGEEQDEHKWRTRGPVLPGKWKCEKGSGSGGATYETWEWIFSGPAESLAEAKKAVEIFLEGFTYSFKD